MVDGLDDEDVLVRGVQRTIAWARDARGRRLAQEFLLGRPHVRARLEAYWRVLADEGRLQNPRVFKRERGSIFTFKVGAVRVVAFQHGRSFLLTHAFEKQRPKWLRQEFERAERIAAEHLRRGWRSR